jgi:hypothetical protein
MSFLKFKVGQPVVLRRGELQQPATVRKKRPEAGLYLVQTETKVECWVHESELQTEAEAAFDKRRF